MARVGILGGSFNPVHVAHVRLAVEVVESLGLDRVEFVLAARPPHKPGEGMLPFELRALLLEKALAGLEFLALNLMEADRSGPSYTWDTLTELTRSRPGDQFHFILGAGDLLSLHQWKNGARLCELASLAVAAREGMGAGEVSAYLEDRPEMGAVAEGEGVWRFPSGKRLELVTIPRLDISASFIRDRFRAGANLRFLVPPKVEDELLRQRGRVLGIWG